MLFDLKNASDGAAWRRFVDNYAKLLFQVCRRTGLHEQEAEDVVQETMAAVARQMPTFEYDRSKGSFKGWLSRVTRNHTADFLEKKTRRNRHLVAEPLADSDGASQLEQSDLDAVWESEWREHLLGRALKRAQEVVSMQNIQIFQLSAVQNWSTQEIMQGVGVSRTQGLPSQASGWAFGRSGDRLPEERIGIAFFMRPSISIWIG